MTLQELRRGDKFRIEGITLKDEIGKRLVDMGLTKGTEGEVLRCALWGDPIEVRVREYNISLRKSEAAGVDVVITDTSRRGSGATSGRRHRRGHGRARHNQGEE